MRQTRVQNVIANIASGKSSMNSYEVLKVSLGCTLGTTTMHRKYIRKQAPQIHPHHFLREARKSQMPSRMMSRMMHLAAGELQVDSASPAYPEIFAGLQERDEHHLAKRKVDAVGTSPSNQRRGEGVV